MDQHPIPQDVTGFQFKLIGTMTVKQFGYVAIGAVIAAVTWYLPFQGIWSLATKFTLVPLFGISGVIVAFVPIEGRPIDVMAKNFFRTLTSPNQYIYIKKGRKFSFTQISYAKNIDQTAKDTKKTTGATSHGEIKKQEQLRALLAHSQGSKSSLDKKEDAFLNTIAVAPSPRPSIAVPTPQQNTTAHIISSTQVSPTPKAAPVASAPAPVPNPSTPHITINPASNPAQPITVPTQSTPHIISATQVNPTPKAAPVAPVQKNPAPTQEATTVTQTKKENLATQETKLQQELASAKQQEANQKNSAEVNAAHQKVLELQKQIQDTHSQKEQLEQELLKLKNQLSAQKTTVSPTPLQQPAPSKSAQNVRSIPQNMSKNAGITQVSDTPNVIVGIVKDARGNILPNILVEVKDKDGNPVRAFKTNPLGQFISATPLANDTYTIELEDPKKQHAFDAIQVIASGQIMSPIEIISHDAREELRKALFNPA